MHLLLHHLADETSYIGNIHRTVTLNLNRLPAGPLCHVLLHFMSLCVSHLFNIVIGLGIIHFQRVIHEAVQVSMFFLIFFFSLCPLVCFKFRVDGKILNHVVVCIFERFILLMLIDINNTRFR